MKLHFISDTHNRHRKVKVPECDILLHCGDWSAGKGEESETKEFLKWLDKQPAKYKVVIPGNHDVHFSRNEEAVTSLFNSYENMYILNDSSVTLEGLKIYGSPYTPAYGFGWAYNAARDPVEASYKFIPEITTIWDKIPEDTDILLTHGPSYGILDLVPNSPTNQGRAGCDHLSKLLLSGKIKNLKVHASGHLHYNGGKKAEVTEGKNTYTAVGASVLNDNYTYTNNGVTIEI